MGAFCLALVAGVTAQSVDRDARVRQAVSVAAASRLVPGAAVSVEVQLVRVPDSVEVDGAEPEPGTRLGRSARYRLFQRRRPVGYAVVVVHARQPHLRVARPVAAGAVVTADDVREVSGDTGATLLERLPGLDVVVGAMARRSLHENEVVTLRSVKVPPAVRSGEQVTVTVVREGFVATGAATALQTGEVGDVIRLINPESRRQIEGRVTGRAQVEVRHES